jgi:hypothetical protein
MQTEHKDALNRQLASLRVAASLIETWVSRKDDPHPEKSYGRLLRQLDAEIEKAQTIVSEHRESLLAAIADRHNQSEESLKSADVVSINVAKDRRAALGAK